MQFTKEYWNDRAIKHGHTGHAKPFIYCFDQQARLFAIHQILKALRIEKNNALDFGSGSGDFVELLSRQFKNVCGYDISETVIDIAKQRFHHSKIDLTSNLSDIEAYPLFDLILTVTVLQGMSMSELESAVSLFSKIVSKSGAMIFMEFFTTDEINARIGEKRITQNEWYKCLNAYHLQIQSEHYFYNPLVSSTKSWVEYRSSLINRFLKYFKKNKWAQNKLTENAKKIIDQYQDAISSSPTPFKIYIVKKSSIVQNY